MGLWIGLAVVGLVILAGILMYNALVSLRVRSAEAWGDIDAQLKRRHDLIPNLVETVKGYVSHERGVLERVTESRSAAVGASGPAAAAQAEGQLTQALRSLFAVAENYPQLRASENFLSLQQSLNQVEDQLQLSRRYYNAVVRDLNTRIQSFPSNIVAAMFAFTPRDFFELEAPEERQPAQVRF